MHHPVFIGLMHGEQSIATRQSKLSVVNQKKLKDGKLNQKCNFAKEGWHDVKEMDEGIQSAVDCIVGSIFII